MVNTPPQHKQKQRPGVYVGLSGGVDSSVSAALLQKQGYDVTGVFIKTWQPGDDDIEADDCAWKDDRRDAMQVAALLGIPFKTLDLTDTYKRDVIGYMVREYRVGRTPNPDVMCNRSVKFGAFLEYALSEGADFIATGHYAQRTHIGNQYALCSSPDPRKDQTYFLWTLTQQQLARTLFPIGHLKKTAVRETAARLGLPTAHKKDSQGLCFIGKIDIRQFLKQYMATVPGPVVTPDGTQIGIHEGAQLYTIGQRHGLSIQPRTAHTSPYHVVKKDVATNTLVATPAPQTEHYATHAITLEQENWIGGNQPPAGPYAVRVRHGQPLQPCTLTYQEKTAIVLFEEPQQHVAAGQSAVLYTEDKNGKYLCLGGSIIRATHPVESFATAK